MIHALHYSAVLLAGGRSTRMGCDKALLPVGEAVLWQRQWDLLAAAGVADRWLSVREEQLWVPDGLPVVRDVLASAGPLGGIAAALEKMRGTHLLVLAVDLPCMDAAWFEKLMALCAPGVGAVGRRDGFYEPLAAIYPRELARDAVARLIRGEYALQRFIAAAGDAMRTVEINAEEVAWFANWNEPGV
ncbi:MAG: molybdenum cofactor guanylyltransferase [Opitutaceae bacterium]|nr:molybdenum cofactor guanylyltransferase [Opitutaceae bacterium]